MTVAKRALEDDSSETAPQAKKVATTTASADTSTPATLLRSTPQADTSDDMTVTKRALDVDDGEMVPQKKVAAAIPSSTPRSTHFLRSTSHAATADGVGAASDDMTVTKRALGDDDGKTAPQAKKIATEAPLETATSIMEIIQPYLDRIAELERVIGEYEAFVHREGLVQDLPDSLMAIIDSRPNAAAMLASNLKRKICVAYDELYDADGPEITNDDYADLLTEFLPDVERLVELKDGPRLAWNVLLLLVDKSRSDEPGNGYEGNDADSAYYLLDETMLDVAKARWGGSKVKKGAESEEMLKDAKIIASVARLLDEYGIKEYMRMTIAFLDKILVMIYPDRYGVEDGGGNGGADNAEEAFTAEEDATVESAQLYKHRDTACGRQAISYLLNREEAVVDEVQFRTGILSMPQMMAT